MRKIRLYGAAGLFALLCAGSVLLAQKEEPSPALSREEAIAFVRAVNTVQASFVIHTKAYASLGQVLNSRAIKQGGAALTLESPHKAIFKNYDVSLTLSPDVKGYHLSLTPRSGCELALFSDESGLIYYGRRIDCPAF